MVLHVLRALFVLLMAAVGWFFLTGPADTTSLGGDPRIWGEWTWLTMAVSLTIGTFIVCVDVLAPRKKLAIFSGTFFGLVVGILIAYALSFVTHLLIDQWKAPVGLKTEIFDQRKEALEQYINMLVGVSTCYLSISFILQTKDDFRFVIPFVEFSKQTKGPRPMLLDTSVLIDGRIADIAATGMIESQLIVPRFVLTELQAVADSADKLKRNRGRRGLDVMAKLQSLNKMEVVLYDSSAADEEGVTEVDQKLMNLAKHLRARVLTNDFNLNKVAQLRGVDVINVNDLANALKPVVLPGEKMSVRLLKEGEEPGQGIGYLEDGTMVVVEQGRGHLNEEVEFTVTSFIQTSAGKMIFGRLSDGSPRRSRSRTDPQPSPTSST